MQASFMWSAALPVRCQHEHRGEAIMIARRLCVSATITLLSVCFPAYGDVSLVSVNASGVKGNGQSTRPDVSADGRFVVFATSSSTLKIGANLQVVVKDTVTGEINQISKAADGTAGDAPSIFPMAISADGRYVVFNSYASNLVAGDTSSSLDLFWHDQLTGQTKMVNLAPDGSQTSFQGSYAAVSANGRYVAFRSLSPDVTADTVTGYQVYVRDTLANVTTLVSRNSSGAPQGGGEPDISTNGRWVVYRGIPNGVYVVDTWNCNSSACNVVRADVNNAGNPVPGHTSVLFPKISGDGNFVAWESNAVGYVADDTNNTADIFVRDLAAGQTSRVSLTSEGLQSNSFSYTPDISHDGRYVSFTSNASNLVASDGNGTLDVFVHDRQTGQTVRVSTPVSGGDANSGAGYYARISDNGQAVAFSSNSSNLVPEDSDATEDVYLASLAPPNEAPIANAGDDQATEVGSTVLLTGVASTDDVTPTGLLSFNWVLTSGPSGSTAVIVDAETIAPTFVPDMPGSYQIQLVVTDEQNEPSAPDTVAIEAEISPAFVFERWHAGSSSYESLYDVDDKFWRGSYSATYWSPASFLGDSALGTKTQRSYNYDSVLGTYSNTYSQAIGELDRIAEDLMVSTGDPVPGSDGDTFSSLYAEGEYEGTLYFRGYGHSYRTNRSNTQFGVDLATGIIGPTSIILPVPVSGETSALTGIWRDYSPGQFTPKYYQGTDGSCPRYRSYTNYYGNTYSYCVYHRGLYIIEGGVATKIVDNTETVPGGNANDYFSSFRSLAVDELTGSAFFIGYWLDDSASRYRQGLFKKDSAGILTKIIDDEALNWDRGWFNTIRIEGGQLYAGGSRYESGNSTGRWWSSSQQGIYRISDTTVEPLATGGSSSWYQSNWYSDREYGYLSASIDTYNFEVEGDVLAYRRHLYAYDNTSTQVEYDSGIFWKEDGVERRIAGTNDEILGVTYDYVYTPWGATWLHGRSLLIRGTSSSYNSGYDAIEQRYTYSGNSAIDVLVARFDTDRDGIGDDIDNCPIRPNPDQLDSDSNGIGDPCEDSDGDSVIDALDNCPLDSNPGQENNDTDTYGNLCDVCPDDTDDQSDVDGDGIGDACDDNSDFDSIPDEFDNCPFITNEDQGNIDTDSLGDVCDPDIDGDGIDNEIDGTWDGASFTDESRIESNNFSDHLRGGISYGRIQNRGQLVVLISDAPDSDRGVIVNVVNGTGRGLIKQCDYRGQDANLDLQQGTIAIIDCGSIGIEAIANSAQLILDQDVVIEVPPQVATRVTDTGDDDFVVSNESDVPIPVVMNLGPDVTVTIPNGSAGRIAETAPGQFEIQNQTESIQPITAEANGVIYVFEPGDVGVPIEVDIKPDSLENTINLGSNGVVPVAILSSTTFDATQVDPATVTLASAPVKLRGKANLMSSVSDINGDGLNDLLVHCDTTALQLEQEAIGAVVKGSTFGGIAIMGTDTIRVVAE